MKRIISILLSVVMTMSIIVLPASANSTADVWDGTVATAFAGGSGTAENPYEIATGAQLAYLAETMWNAYSQGANSPIISSTGERSTDAKPLYNAYTGVYFKLTSDIDLNNKEWTPIGSYAVRFNGNFDGNGHIV